MHFRVLVALLLCLSAPAAERKKKPCGPASAQVAAGTPVVQPVPGLLQGIPSTLSARPGPTRKEKKNPPRVALTPDITVSDRMGWEDTYDEHETKIHTVTSTPWYKDPTTGVEVQGNFKLGYHEAKNEFIIDQVFLDYRAQDPQSKAIVDFPHWINADGVPPLVDGKGIPAGMFLTLRAAKILKVPTGKPLNVRVQKIRDFATLAAFETAKRQWIKDNPAWARANEQGEPWQTRTMIPDEVKTELIRDTHSVKFAEGVLAQMGLRIKSVKFVGQKYTQAPDYQHDVGTLVSLRLQKDWDVPWQLEPQMAKFEEAGLQKSDRIESDFDIEIETEPIP